MTKLLAFNGNPELKAMLLEEVRRHREQDQIIQGTYGQGKGDNWKGCSVGCAIHSLNLRMKTNWDTNDYTVYEKELGIPERIARLEDSIFEGLTEAEAKLFPEQFIEAIPVGADLSRVIAAFCEWLLVDPKQGSIRFAREEDKAIIREVAALHAKVAAGKLVTEEEWSAAWSAARSAARAAWSAESAARSAARSAESAAWSAARSAAWSAAWAARSAQAKKLLELLREAPVKKSKKVLSKS